MHTPFQNETEREIHDLALDMVGTERLRQVRKGYDCAHDDQHGGEELATAAAFLLIPEYFNQDVCFCTSEYGLKVEPLHSLIAENAWDGLHREAYDGSDAAAIDTRIGQLTKGIACGLAELERWLRMRALADQAGGA